MSKSVLDHGYVSLVEGWGSDAKIIEAARMSTGKGFLGWGTEEKPGDEKLLRFLWENKHATPFEMGGLTIEVQAPIFVFREWHRHRTQCLTGDAMIACVTPNGATYQRSIKSIFDLKHGGVVDAAPTRHRNGTSRAGTIVTRAARRKDAWRTRVLPNCQSRTLRVLDEATGLFSIAKMADVWESGKKLIYLVETVGGHALRASAEHPFFTQRGWVKVKDLEPDDRVARMGKVAAEERPIPPALRQGIGVWTSMMRVRLIHDEGPCYLCGETFARHELALDHVVPVSESLLAALDERNLRPACVPCHRAKTDGEQPARAQKSRRGIRWERLASKPCAVGEEPTFDIEVHGPHHNYVANGLVVHNSYNEMSARYTPLPDINYIPTVERLLINAGTSNKQAGTVAGSGVLDEAGAESFRLALLKQYASQQALYEEALAAGVPKELARIHLPVGRYSRMRASANLRNWLAFLTLRTASGAQWEIRQYAQAVAGYVAEAFPRTCEIFAAKS